ncbi:glycoside hydrolase family 20 protein [Rikenella microfusus]|uniref:glycoside hydrolase family 20 protein n=3 Tax=Rikenella microfusus TaxID=28139 RepID=UPI001D64AABB|nr:family 20 glycosylhydrolase [Rikenella microfusus]HJE88763.1 family 20 glycosylhydrolase [Rikenella microfusus]
MKKIVSLCAAAALLLASCSESRKAGKIAVIPAPVHMESGLGDFILDKATVVAYPAGDSVLARAGGMISETLGATFGTALALSPDTLSGTIVLVRPEHSAGLKPEGYRMVVSPDRIAIETNDYNGAFYALQTLLQLLPAEVYGTGDNGADAYAVPAVTIEDYPRFGWRGMHLDVSRHFHPVGFVKRYIDLLAMHKFNRFHWHLTDDQGWRLEIKKYPLLTEKSAWRVDRNDDGWETNRPPLPGEKATYGGFYTQDEVRDVVAYAAARGVTVIPEIEMPGHSGEVFAAYPHLSCLGKEQFVTPGGYYPDGLATCFCAGNDSSFLFLQGVIDEVVELFPDAPYIHVGGDEVDMQFWSNCPKCRKRMAELGLKNTHELQSYFMHRMEEYINSKGKAIIGWDEILEGGVAPNATVMSWRGEAGGIEAARMGHDVVMTPDTYLYFDFYQNDPQVEPRAAGGFTTTKKVYGYEPVPAVLTSDEAKHILGAQANVWCEHIRDGKHVEYMVLPRMAALSEVVWSPKEARDYEDFAGRLETQYDRYEAMDAVYHPGADRIVFSPVYDSAARQFRVALATEFFGGVIHYTTDGSEPTAQSPVYTEPIRIDSMATVRAIVVKDGRRVSKAVASQTLGFHKGSGKAVKYNTVLSPAYAGSPVTLVDGLTGSLDPRSGLYQGCDGADFDVIVDLGERTKFTEVTGSFLQAASSWIYLPEAMTVSISDDGEHFTEAGRVERQVDMGKLAELRYLFTVRGNFDARYVRVVGVNGITPSGLKGAGQKNWIFADEIFIR